MQIDVSVNNNLEDRIFKLKHVRNANICFGSRPK